MPKPFGHPLVAGYITGNQSHLSLLAGVLNSHTIYADKRISVQSFCTRALSTEWVDEYKNNANNLGDCKQNN